MQRAVSARPGASRLLLLLAAALALAPAAGALPFGPDDLARLEERVAELDLDAETRAACYAEIDAARAAQRALREEMLLAHDRMRRLLEQDQPSEAEVMAQADLLGGLVAEAHKNDLRTLLHILSLLDEGQRASMRELEPAPGGDRFPPEAAGALEQF
jgi:Spy/CpxP family protein refolding chaperone